MIESKHVIETDQLTKTKQVLFVYMIAFWIFITLAIIFIHATLKVFFVLCYILMLSMFNILEYLHYGMSSRVVCDILFSIGISIGLIIGMNSNSHLYLPTVFLLIGGCGMVMGATYRALKKQG